MTRVNSKNFLLLGLCLILLTACGFHLQGTVQLPAKLKTVYLHSFSPYNELTKETRFMLRFSGIRIVDSPKNAPVTLDLSSENLSYAQTTVTGSDQLQSYTVTYTVYFSIKDKKGNTVTSHSVSDNQTIQILKDEVLTNSNKLKQAQTTLTRKVIVKILYYLSAKNTIKALDKSLQNP